MRLPCLSLGRSVEASGKVYLAGADDFGGAGEEHLAGVGGPDNLLRSAFGDGREFARCVVAEDGGGGGGAGSGAAGGGGAAAALVDAEGNFVWAREGGRIPRWCRGERVGSTAIFAPSCCQVRLWLLKSSLSGKRMKCGLPTLTMTPSMGASNAGDFDGAGHDAGDAHIRFRSRIRGRRGG